MGSMFVSLLPSAIALALTPAAVSIAILLLGSRRPVANAGAFALAFALVYGVMSVVVLSVASQADGQAISDRTKSVVELVVGLGLLAIAAVFFLRTRDATGEKKSALVRAAESATPSGAFKLGLLAAIVNPNVAILTSGLAVILASSPSGWEEWVGVAFLILGSQVGLAGPILWYLADPAGANARLAQVKAWLSRNERILDLGVLVVFGVVFTFKGVAGL